MKQPPKSKDVPYEALKDAALSTPLRPNKYNRKPRRKGRRFTRWDSLQKEAITTEFNSNGQNISKTARQLGLSRNAVLRKLKRYGLKNVEKQP